MAKRRSGPEGPDPDPEPFENETPEAALEYHKSDFCCVQPSSDAGQSRYRW